MNEYFGVVRFEFESFVQSKTGFTKLKSAHVFFIICHRSSESKIELLDFMGYKSFDVVRFKLGSVV